LTIHEKVQYLLKNKGRGSQKELARVLGEDVTYLNKWVKGTKPIPQKYLLPTALHLGVTVDYLLDDKQEIPENKQIPIIGNSLSSVPIKSFYDENIKYIPVLPNINASTSYAIYAKGDNMLHSISDNDIVICDASKPPVDNTIVHYTYNNKSGINRVKSQEDGSIILIPDNKEYPPVVIPKDKRNNLSTARCIRIIKNLETYL